MTDTFGVGVYLSCDRVHRWSAEPKDEAGEYCDD
jgi:hypothetical protein